MQAICPENQTVEVKQWWGEGSWYRGSGGRGEGFPALSSFLLQPGNIFFARSFFSLHARFLCITTEQLENAHEDARWGSGGCVRQLGGKQVCWVPGVWLAWWTGDRLKRVLSSYSISPTVQLPSSLSAHQCAI